MALGAGPRLLLMDELGGGLSPRGRDEVYRVCERLRGRGLTVIPIEHAVGWLARLADRVVVLEQGAVVTVGRPHEIFASRRIVAAYVGVTGPGPELLDDPAVRRTLPDMGREAPI